MLNNSDELRFYVLSCVALLLLMWGLNLFGLRSYPFALPMLFVAFLLNPILSGIGQGMLGPGSGQRSSLAVGAMGVFAFAIVWASNRSYNALDSLALPAAIMFVIPSVLRYIRENLSGSESNVRA